MAPVVLKHAIQPIVDAAHFQDRDELVVILQPISGQLLKEGLDLLRVRRDLSSLQDIPVVIAERNRDLSRVLIDSKVQHGRSPSVGESCWSPLPMRLDNCSIQQE
jgi:hypothetical protein